MPDNKDILHPVRFTKRQVEFIDHMICEKGMDYWEEECEDLLNTIKENVKQNDS